MDNWHSINQFFPKRQLRARLQILWIPHFFWPRNLSLWKPWLFHTGLRVTTPSIKNHCGTPSSEQKIQEKHTHISNPSMFYMSSSHSHGKISHRSPNIFKFLRSFLLMVIKYTLTFQGGFWDTCARNTRTATCHTDWTKPVSISFHSFLEFRSHPPKRAMNKFFKYFCCFILWLTISTLL